MRFAELVFHVLAHVPGDAAASAFDPNYVAFVARHLGAASSRPLGEDVAVLSSVREHDRLVAVQMLAWVWHGASRAPVDRTLAELDDVDDRAALAAAMRETNLAEVLRAAAELETESYAALPPPTFERDVLDRAIARVLSAAPHLRVCTVECVRPLRLRGRVRGRVIWVGAPCEVLGPTPEHAAWQAAHEATVAEVSERARAAGVAHDHDGLEHAAAVLLAERAHAAGLSAEHRGWLDHLAHVPVNSREAVPPVYRALMP